MLLMMYNKIFTIMLHSLIYLQYKLWKGVTFEGTDQDEPLFMLYGGMNTM